MRRFFIAFATLIASAPAFATDLSITAANVKAPGTTVSLSRVKFGEAVTQGQAVYRKESDGKYYKGDADAGSTEAASIAGVAITPGSTDEYGYIATEGPVTIGATLTVGEIYVLSGTAGGICPEADLANPDKVTIIGVATSSTVLSVLPFPSNATVP